MPYELIDFTIKKPKDHKIVFHVEKAIPRFAIFNNKSRLDPIHNSSRYSTINCTLRLSRNSFTSNL